MKNLSLYNNDLSVPRKSDVDAKQDKVLVDGILQGDGTGAISAADTTEVELVELSKADVGLGNVDNTSDANKPISTATQTALNSKQATITGGATTITSSNLTANRALVSNSSGKVAVSAVTSTELGYLDGVTSNVQTQLNGKQANITANGILKGDGSGGVTAAVAGTDYLASAPVASVNGKTGAVSLTASDVGAVDLTSEQTVAGNKTFTGNNTFDNSDGLAVTFGSGISVLGTNSSTFQTPVTFSETEVDFTTSTVTGLTGLLPTVTTADNNKHLRVVSGKWATSDIGGHATYTITLTASGWSNNAQAIQVTGITPAHTIIVSPAPSSLLDYASAQVYCSAQGVNRLQFACTTAPTTDLTVNVVNLFNANT